MTNRFVYFAKQNPPNSTHTKAKDVSSQANTSLRAVCMIGNYLKRRSGGLRIRVLKKMPPNFYL